MKIDDRVRLAIGDLVLQIQGAHARIEELEAALAEALKEKEPVPQQESRE